MKSSTEPGAATGLVTLGKVIGAHGLRGMLRVHCFGDNGENLLRATQVFVSPDTRGCNTQRSESEARYASYKVLDAAPGRAREVRLKLEGVNDRNAAELLRGTFVCIVPQSLQELEPGEYYWHELVGCRVEDESGAEIGTVESLLETGAHDLLVVRVTGEAQGKQGEQGTQEKNAKTHLIPTVPEFLREVDVEKRRIVVHVIPGLIDEN